MRMISNVTSKFDYRHVNIIQLEFNLYQIYEVRKNTKSGLGCIARQDR